MRLLVVEDEADCAFVLAKRLEMRGHAVRVCNNACSALAAAPEFHPDAVLLDIGLPGMDGWQLAPLLRDALQDEELLLIAISGFQTEKDFLRSRAAGIDYHLPKPNYFDRLLELLPAS
ncbi:MAG TPA: response regulator [Pirellulales bacterium]|nr:response regulator [Pirellulales bacterium]